MFFLLLFPIQNRDPEPSRAAGCGIRFLSFRSSVPSISCGRDLDASAIYHVVASNPNGHDVMGKSFGSNKLKLPVGTLSTSVVWNWEMDSAAYRRRFNALYRIDCSSLSSIWNPSGRDACTDDVVLVAEKFDGYKELRVGLCWVP